jgi:membrane protein YdbS with pleckstrin-like domain
MKIARPAFPRAVTNFIETAIGSAILAAFFIGLIKFAMYTTTLENPRHPLPPEIEQNIMPVMLAGFGLLTAYLSIKGFFSTLSARYDFGATEMTLHHGFLRRETTTIPLATITRIETSTGPLMRLLGLTDLHVYGSPSVKTGFRESPTVVLSGLRDAEDLRRFLLDRRDTLRESALRGDLAIGQSAQELELHRLATAIERLERRLPVPSSREKST